jgi:hypothetical protein
MTRDEAIAILDQLSPPLMNGNTKLAERINTLVANQPADRARMLEVKDALEAEARAEYPEHERPFVLTGDPISPTFFRRDR